jgi:dTDP-L-rhamnose 4-epimerase
MTMARATEPAAPRGLTLQDVRVLVTGGAGFVGGHVADTLGSAGHDVRVLDALLPEVHGSGVPPVRAGVEFLRADLRDAAAVEDAVRGVDAVCHQAAMVGLGLDIADAPSYVGCNDLGTAVLLAAMARSGVRQLVLASSMVVYGEGRYRCPADGEVSPGPRRVADLEAGRFDPPCPRCGGPLAPTLVSEQAPPDPRSVYAATKLAQEHLAACWARATGGEAVALRYHNVYGPRMPRDTPYAGVASIFRSALAAGRPPGVFEDGGQRRDFVHVSDVARANLVALEALGRQPADGRLSAYNVGSGVPHTVGDLAHALAAACGGPAPVVTREYRLADVRHVTASSARIADELGWRAEIPFEAGMAEFARQPLRDAPAAATAG